MTLDQIRTALADRRIGIVARETGLHPNTLYDIRDGRTQNPSWQTVQKLTRYLTGGDAE